MAVGLVLALVAGRSLLRTVLQARPAAPRKPVAPSGPRKEPGFEFQGTRLKVVDPRSGRLVWEISLDQAESVAATGETWLKGIAAEYHNLDGSVSRLSSGTAHLAAGGAALDFSGEVRLSATNGGTVTAGTLHWEAGKEEFRALGAEEKEVRFTRGGTALKAPEIRGDMALKKVQATGGVRFSGAGE